MRISRLLAAGFLAPFAVIPAVLVSFVAVHIVDIIQFDFLSPHRHYEMLEFLEDSVPLMFFGVFFGWFLMIVFGYPAYALLRLGGLAQAIPAALIGAVFGALFGAAMSNTIEPAMIVVMTTCGASVAATFCRIANKPQAPLHYFE